MSSPKLQFDNSITYSSSHPMCETHNWAEVAHCFDDGCIYSLDRGSMDRSFWREECNSFSFQKATHLACLAKPVSEAMDVNV